MAEQQVDETLLKADRWSKTIALFFALGLFLLATQLTPNTQFNMIIAAFGAIGVRLYVPYHVSISGFGPDTVPSQAYETGGDYHHGAVGAGLTIGSIVALGVMLVEPTFNVAFGAGIGVAVVVYLVLRSLLPSE